MSSLTFPRVLILTNLFVFLFGCATSPTQGSSSEITEPDFGITTRISILEKSFKSSEGIRIQVIFTNTGDQPAKILLWLTPIQGVEHSLFQVSKNNEPVLYTGKLVKRSAPTEDDYLTLNAGESVSSEVDLKMYYNISDPGAYKVKYDVCSFELFGIMGGVTQNNTKMYCLSTGDLEFVIEG